MPVFSAAEERNHRLAWCKEMRLFDFFYAQYSRRRLEHLRRLSLSEAKSMEIVIFQMGKVASTALAAALRKEGLEALQGHVASPERLATKLKIMAAPHLSETVAYTMYQDFHQELRAMYLLSRRKVAPDAYAESLRVITPTRDPLSWYWSHFAQMYHHYNDQLLRYFLDKGGKERDFKPDEALLAILEQMFSFLASTSEPLDDPQSLPRIQKAAKELDASGIVSAQANRFLLPLRWFNEDFHPAVGISVYDHPFNISEGFGQIDVPGFKIMLYRYEQLQQVHQHVATFVDRPGFSLGRRNSTEDKDIPPAVVNILKEGRNLVPKTLKDRIYESRYARHFGYSAS